MRALVLGARGAVGAMIRRRLEEGSHGVTAAHRSAPGDRGADLHGDLTALQRLAAAHDVVVNASGVERGDLATTTGSTPLVKISASGAYLEALGASACGPVVLGAGLVPGLSTILVAALDPHPGDEVDLHVMLGTGERHGPAAVAWTAALVGTDVHRPPEGGTVRNLRESLRAIGPESRARSPAEASRRPPVGSPHWPPRVVQQPPTGAVTMAELLTLDDALAAPPPR